MEHLDFVNKLNETGISVRSGNIVGMENRFDINGVFGESNTIIQYNYKLKWKNQDARDALVELIKLGIDMDQWKHSWHNEIKSENYNKFQDIIQKKILDRAEEIRTLLSIYFQIGKEISNL